jgi:hypothetical protein
MYVCIRVGHKGGPCTATFNDLYVLEYTFALLSIPHVNAFRNVYQIPLNKDI